MPSMVVSPVPLDTGRVVALVVVVVVVDDDVVVVDDVLLEEADSVVMHGTAAGIGSSPWPVKAATTVSFPSTSVA